MRDSLVDKVDFPRHHCLDLLACSLGTENNDSLNQREEYSIGSGNIATVATFPRKLPKFWHHRQPTTTPALLEENYGPLFLPHSPQMPQKKQNNNKEQV